MRCWCNECLDWVETGICSSGKTRHEKKYLERFCPICGLILLEFLDEEEELKEPINYYDYDRCDGEDDGEEEE